ncbi:MAG: 6-bladed beta-propeller [Mangrovibacterium sp.]
MKNYLILILIIVSFSCSRPKSIKTNIISIDINDKSSQDLPELSINSIIPLETNESSLFGDIMTIEYFSDRIFILDAFNRRSLLAFTNEGHYLNRTKLGKGPEEMINPFAFCIDREKDNILVWDQTLSEMFIYDLDLNVLSRNRYNVTIQQFAKVSDNNMLVFAHYKQDFLYKLYSNQFDKVKGEFVKDSKYEGVHLLSKPISTDSRTLMIAPLDYNIYQLTQSGVHSEYFIDFGKYNIKSRDIQENNFKSAWRQVYAGQKVSSLYGIAESDNFILFQIFFKDKRIYYVHSLKTNKTYRINDYFEKGMLPECQVRGIVKNDIFYATVEPTEMILFQERINQNFPFKKILPEDNYVIIAFSIKELLE